MKLRIVFAVAALVSGLTAAAADAADSTVTCRKIQTGGVSSICRWRFSKNESVDVYYGEPSPPRPSPQPETNYAPEPVYDEEPVGYDYGYAWPWAYGVGPVFANRGGRDHHHGPGDGHFHGRPANPAFGFQGRTTVPSAGFHGRAAVPSSGFQGRTTVPSFGFHSPAARARW